MNILLITVDSLRADAPGVYGGKARTPNIDSLARMSWVFKQAFSTGPITIQSFPGILASNYPTTDGRIQTLDQRVSLACVMKDAGFKTGAFHSNPVLSASRGYSRGFDHFWDSLEEQHIAVRRPGLGPFLRLVGEKVARRSRATYRLFQRVQKMIGRHAAKAELPYVLAEDLNDRVKDWIAENREGKFFLWVHYMDTHWPYAVAPRFGDASHREHAIGLAQKALRTPDKLTREEVDELRRLYHQEVEYLDKCLGDLFESLRSYGLWDNTVVVFTSDHGDEFLEHGVCFHTNLLYDTLIHVPLIIKLAPGVQDEVVDKVVSLIDIAPTVCEVVRVPVPNVFEGRSLFQHTGDGVAIAEVAPRFISDKPEMACIRTTEWKYIHNLMTGEEELYHLTEDPGETNNRISSELTIAEKLRGKLALHFERPRPAFGTEETLTSTGTSEPFQQEDDEEVLARLKGLGYID